MTEISPEVEAFDSTAYKVADGIEVAFVATPTGPVRLGQGDPLPEGVHPNEVARLANGGVLADVEPANLEGDELPEIANLEELKLRVGADPDDARRFLEAENARQAGPRKTWAAHLESVIADAGEDGPVVSADVEAGGVAVVDGEGA